MTILQCDPPMPMVVDIKGDGNWKKGYAHFVIDYGLEFDLYWAVFMDDNGQCWTVNNKYVRLQYSFTSNRMAPDSNGVKLPNCT